MNQQQQAHSIQGSTVQIKGKYMADPVGSPSWDQSTESTDISDQSEAAHSISRLSAFGENQQAEVDLGLDKAAKIASDLAKDTAVSFKKATIHAIDKISPKKVKEGVFDGPYGFVADEEAFETEQSIKRQIERNSALGRLKHSCLSAVPDKAENFAFGFKIELNKPVLSYLFMPLFLNLFQKVLAIVFYFYSVRVHKKLLIGRVSLPLRVTQMAVPTLLIAPLLYRLGKESICKNWFTGFICYLVDTVLLSLLYAYALHDIEGTALILFVANLAGDVTLILNFYSPRRTSDLRGFTS